MWFFASVNIEGTAELAIGNLIKNGSVRPRSGITDIEFASLYNKPVAQTLLGILAEAT
jgi:hypothetical protein